MKIIREPKVYLVGKQKVCEEELDRFLADEGAAGWETDTCVGAEKLAEVAGRLCYTSYSKPRPGGNKAYLGHIIESKHGSVAEHAVWNFIFTGISRSLTHELIRHRIGTGFSQLSQRFVDESVAEYVEPDVIANTPELHEIWFKAIEGVHQAYVTLSEKLHDKILTGEFAKIKCGGTGHTKESYYQLLTREEKTSFRKKAREAARSVLPNATETKIFVTANARSLRHMVEMRASRHADVEIRKLFCQVWEIMASEAPNLFGDYQKVDLGDGTYELVTQNRKV